MIVDKIARKILEKRREFFINSKLEPLVEPIFAVYMDQEIYCNMMQEIKGPVSSFAMEVVNSKTVLGCKIYRVIESHPLCIFKLDSYHKN